MLFIIVLFNVVRNLSPKACISFFSGIKSGKIKAIFEFFSSLTVVDLVN